MELYLLRHGEAGDHQPHGDDSKRPLTADGIARMKRQAATLHAWKLPIDVILSSPFTRARQTADIVAEAFGLPVTDDDRLRAGADLKDLERILKDYARTSALLLAGHQPDLGEMLAGVIGGGDFRFEKGGLACVQIDKPATMRGTLRWFLSPKLMGAED